MKLLEPITIRGVEFKNRAVMAPMRLRIGMIGPQARAYYLERAKGGFGAIISGATSVDMLTSDEAWERHGGADAYLREISLLTDEIHRAGSRIGVQLWHGNRFPAGMGAEDTRGEPVSPSPSVQGRQLTTPEIEAIISRFAQAAVNARKAGFDFVEIHGAHGYLPCQFLSPVTNKRNDRYGGDLARRMRFGIECVSAVREAIGPDHPVFYRLGARDEVPGGITPDEAARFAAELEKAGADVIDVSLGGMLASDGSYTIPSLVAMPGPDQPEGAFVPLAEVVKRAVSVPVIAVGRFRTPRIIEEVLAQGKADMVNIGRQTFAEPGWLNKVAEGTPEEIRPCISCNSCFETRLDPNGITCSVNAAATREVGWTLARATARKRVIVIGGGPAGMEAARVAATRGHDVTIYEKEAEMGGQLIPAAVPPYKYEIEAFRQYLFRQLEKSGARIRPGVQVTAELLEQEKPDAVVIATGAAPRMPRIAGMAGDRVMMTVDVLLGRASPSREVVVIGGELVACETADFLCQQGKRVTILRRGPEMASRLFPGYRQTLLARLKDHGATLITGIQEYVAMTDDGLVIIDGQGSRQAIEADSIVIAAGAVPNNRLAEALRDRFPEVYLAGDCVQPNRILNAIHDGARIGRQL